MGVGGEDLSGDIAGEIPGRGVFSESGEREIDGGKIAAVVAVACADDHRDEVAGLDGEVFDGADFDFGGSVSDTGGEFLAGGTATKFEGPDDAVAAFGMGVLDDSVDAHGGSDGAAPGGGDAEGG